MSLKSDRVGCQVLGCRRTTARKFDGHEWVCSIHWKLVPATLKRRYRLVRTRFRRTGDVMHETLCVSYWKRCKEAAVQGAAGI